MWNPMEEQGILAIVSAQYVAQGPEGSSQGNQLRTSHVDLWVEATLSSHSERDGDTQLPVLCYRAEFFSHLKHLVHHLCTQHPGVSKSIDSQDFSYIA